MKITQCFAEEEVSVVVLVCLFYLEACLKTSVRQPITYKQVNSAIIFLLFLNCTQLRSKKEKKLKKRTKENRSWKKLKNEIQYINCVLRFEFYIHRIYFFKYMIRFLKKEKGYGYSQLCYWISVWFCMHFCIYRKLILLFARISQKWVCMWF